MKCCSIEGCSGTVKAKGLCPKHYYHSRMVDPEFRKQKAEAKKRFKEANPDYAERQRELFRQRYRNDPEYQAKQKNKAKTEQARTLHRERLSKFPREAVILCREIQEGRCGICSNALSTEIKRSRFGECADHCHDTLVPRGLLCAICNTHLGKYEKHLRPTGFRIEQYEAYLNNPPVKQLVSAGVLLPVWLVPKQAGERWSDARRKAEIERHFAAG